VSLSDSPRPGSHPRPAATVRIGDHLVSREPSPAGTGDCLKARCSSSGAARFRPTGRAGRPTCPDYPPPIPALPEPVKCSVSGARRREKGLGQGHQQNPFSRLRRTEGYDPSSARPLEVRPSLTPTAACRTASPRIDSWDIRLRRGVQRWTLYQAPVSSCGGERSRHCDAHRRAPSRARGRS
jgi:hypothetical protein